MKRIGNVAKELNITTRTLRFWEDSGLIKSIRTDGNYRLYDDENYEKIRQISFWRRLGLPVESVLKVMNADDDSQMLDILNNEIASFKEKKRLNEATIMICDIILAKLRTENNIEKVYNLFGKTSENPKITNSYEFISNLLLRESDAKEFDYELPETLDMKLETAKVSDIEEMHGFIDSAAGDIYDASEAKNAYAFYETVNIPMYNNFIIYKDGKMFGIVQLERVWKNSLLINGIIISDHEYDRAILCLLTKAVPGITTWLIRFDEKKTTLLNDNRKRFCEANSFSHLTSHRYVTYSRSFANTNKNTELENEPTMSLLTDLLNNNKNYMNKKYNNCVSYDTVIKECEYVDCMIENSSDFKAYENNNQRIKCRFNNNKYAYSDFKNNDFKSCSLENTDFNGCIFENCKIDGIDISDAIKFYKENKK